jgi:hypothetical protein
MGRYEGTDEFLGEGERFRALDGPESLPLVNLDKCLVQTADAI